MPIHKVDGGYQWGNHGKVYSSRKGAEKQAAAAHANGYVGDMTDQDWRGLFRGMLKFFAEERQEPEHQAEDSVNAAGIAARAPSGRMLFLKRSGAGDHAGEWCLPGGTAEDGEEPWQTALREFIEETLMRAEIGKDELKPIHAHSLNGVDFATYLYNAKDEFEPKLNGEHTEFKWADPKDPPQPLHPGVKKMLEAHDDRILAHDSALLLAFDKNSVRRYDDNGHLHVDESNISKACVNPYLGREIPGYEELGLEPGKIYKLLRDPKELKKAAKTFGGVPLLIKHTPVSADDHPKDDTVGTIGTEVRYEHPYLRAPLVVWDKDGIDAIENEDQRQLSSGYHYRVDMTPGEYEGEPYDGVMRDIRGNHVALVKEGRAGPDVIVGDEAIPTGEIMAKTILSRKAATALGAISVFLKPKLAQDTKLDLTSILGGITSKNFSAKKPAIVAGIEKATKGKLAQDASVEGLADLLDALEDVKPAEAGDADPDAGKPGEEDPDKLSDKNIPGEDDQHEVHQELIEMLKGMGLSDEQLQQIAAKLGGKPDAGEPEDDEVEEDEQLNPNAATPAASKPKEEKMVSQKAMDSALKKVKADTLAAARAVREAENEVEPYVGKLAVAFDSADEVYKAALEVLEVDIDGVHPSAYRSMLKLVPLDKKSTGIAQDTAPQQDMSSYEKMFPTAKRIGVA